MRKPHGFGKHFAAGGEIHLMRTGRISNRAGVSFSLAVAGAMAGLIQMRLLGFQFGGTEMVTEARTLAEHGVFANPYAIAKTGLTAANPPLYPLFLALLIRLSPQYFVVLGVIGNIAANAVAAACLPQISRVFYDDDMPGVVAGVLWLAAMQLTPGWDTGDTVAGLSLFCLFTAWSIGRKGAAGLGALAGVAGGLLCLTNISSAMVSLPWVACLVARRSADRQASKVARRQAALFGCALFAAFLLVVAPWVLRNRQQLGAPVLRTGLGIALYSSNNDCAESSLVDTWWTGCFQAHHPNTSLSEARLLGAMGEVAYDRLRMEDAKRWAAANPARFRRLTAERIRDFWFPTPDHPFPHQRAYTAYAVWLATVLGIAGLILMIRERRPVVVFVLIVGLIYPLIYYVTVSDVRYRYPILWLSLLPAGYFICAIGIGAINAGWLRRRARGD